MKLTETKLSGVWVIEPIRHRDRRGSFSEVYRRDRLAEAGFDRPFVQDNHAENQGRGVVRGLHYQRPPHAQAKLVRVTRGAILDVVVDLRQSSPTFGQHVAVELSAENWKQLLVPEGLAHGYATLTEQTEVLYKVDAYYHKDSERGILWSDPVLGIDWPVSQSQAVVSDKDRNWPVLSGQADLFD